MLLLLYLWLYEPYGLQKEAAARSLVQQLGEEYVRSEYQSYTEHAECHYDPQSNFNQQAIYSHRGFVAVDCRVATPCGPTIGRPVWHNPLVGAFMTAEPYSWTIAEACIEMLNDAAHTDVLANMNQGG